LLRTTPKTNYVKTKAASNSAEEELHMFAIGGNSSKSSPITCEVTIEGTPLNMEVDTGAEVSIISDCTRKLLLPTVKLTKTKLVLKTYTEETMPVLGELSVTVQYGNQTKLLLLVVVTGDGPSLLGRNWLKCLRLDWKQIGKVALESLPGVNSLLDQHKAIFTEELGTVTTHKATL
jgi:hypothetical protein